MYFMIFILVSNTNQNEIDGVDDEYQVEVVRYGDDLLLDSTFQEPTSENITQNVSTEPGKDLFYILFIFLLYICIQLAYYIFNSILLSETYGQNIPLDAEAAKIHSIIFCKNISQRRR